MRPGITMYETPQDLILRLWYLSGSYSKTSDTSRDLIPNGLSTVVKYLSGFDSVDLTMFKESLQYLEILVRVCGVSKLMVSFEIKCETKFENNLGKQKVKKSHAIVAFNRTAAVRSWSTIRRHYKYASAQEGFFLFS